MVKTSTTGLPATGPSSDLNERSKNTCKGTEVSDRHAKIAKIVKAKTVQAKLRHTQETADDNHFDRLYTFNADAIDPLFTHVYPRCNPHVWDNGPFAYVFLHCVAEAKEASVRSEKAAIHFNSDPANKVRKESINVNLNCIMEKARTLGSKEECKYVTAQNAEDICFLVKRYHFRAQKQMAESRQFDGFEVSEDAQVTYQELKRWIRNDLY